MKLIKKNLSRRAFLKGGAISCLAALGLAVVMPACGPGGAIVGDLNDDAGDMQDMTQWKTVYMADVLYDASTGERASVGRLPSTVYKKLKILASRYLFDPEKSAKGFKHLRALRRLNSQFKAVLRENNFAEYTPLLRPVRLHKMVAEAFAGRTIDLYTKNLQNYLMKVLQEIR